MEAPLIIEILDRFGKVRSRQRADQFPLRIGRAYDNDIILDDPYISPQHVELTQNSDGHIQVTDLQSENGLFSLHPLERHEQLVLGDNDRIRIGRTEIRLRSIRHPVKETYIDRLRPSKLHLLLNSSMMFPIAWLLSALIFSIYFYEQSYRDVTFGATLSRLLPIYIYMLVWSSMWSIVSKLVTHKFSFTYHAILTSIIVSLYYLIDPLFEYLEFMSSIDNLANYLSLILVFILPIILIYGNLRQSTILSRSLAGMFASLATLLIIGTFYLIFFLNQPDFDPQPDYSQTLKAPMFDYHHGQSIDQFFADTRPLGQFDIEQEDKPKHPES